MTDLTANQLAADVRDALDDYHGYVASDPTEPGRKAYAALDELVGLVHGGNCIRGEDGKSPCERLQALVGTLQQERDEWRDLAAKEARAGIARDKERIAAEAALAEANTDKEKLHTWGEEWKVRARDAEAALATTRQALTEIAELPGWPLPHKAIARRALADTGGDTA